METQKALEIAQYFLYTQAKGNKFFVLRPEGLKRLSYDPAIDCNVFYRYLISAEKSGAKFFILTKHGIKRIYFKQKESLCQAK